MSTDKNQDTKVITGKVRFSYLHIWEPTSVEQDGEKKYSASLIIPKSDKAMVARIKAAIEAAKEQGKVKFGGKVPATLKLPLRDGDLERPEDEAYANSFFINANCKTQPGIVDKKRQKILNQEEVYSGCYGLASITFYAFNTKGNKGIACGLNHIMKQEDGEALGGRVAAEIDFADVSVDDQDDDLL